MGRDATSLPQSVVIVLAAQPLLMQAARQTSILFIKGQTRNRPTNMYLHAFLLSVEWIIKNNETFISKQEYSDPYKSSTHCRRDAHRLLEFMF